MTSRNTIVLGTATAAALVALASIFLHRNSDENEMAEHLAKLEAQALSLAQTQKEDAMAPVEGEVYYDEDEADMETADQEGLSPEELAKLPEWAREFAKLGKEARAQFLLSFSIAKAAYARESWAECVAILNECELIFDANPNVWNLRACALIEIESFDEAETYVKRTLAYKPADPIGLLNLANIQMARRDFSGSIKTLETLRKDLRSEGNHDQLDIFTFRQLLCHLMLRQEMEARALVTELNALHDSPLFYCAEAAFAIYKNDSNAARRALDSASRIYGRSPLLNAYRKWLERCGLREKFMDGKEVEDIL